MVAIKDFGMPTSCGACEMFDGDGCVITQQMCKDGWNIRSVDCPLVEIKESRCHNQ